MIGNEIPALCGFGENFWTVELFPSEAVFALILTYQVKK